MGNVAAPLNDVILIAVAQLVDDSQSGRRDPSHSDLTFTFQRHGLGNGDPVARGQSAGKAKRVRATLSWAVEHAPAAGAQCVAALIDLIRGHGGFRDGSPNYIGNHAYQNAAEAFAAEGYELGSDGDLRPRLLDGLDGFDLPKALDAYVRRAKRGAGDAALVTGTARTSSRLSLRTSFIGATVPTLRRRIFRHFSGKHSLHRGSPRHKRFRRLASRPSGG
jgi:hypothetical protein